MSTPTELEKQQYYKTAGHLATKSVYHVFKIAKHRHNIKRYQELYKENISGDPTVSKKLTAAQAAYRIKLDNSKIGKEILSLNSDVIMGALVIATMTAGPLGTAAVLTTAAATYGMKALLDYTMDQFDKSSITKAENVLYQHLK